MIDHLTLRVKDTAASKSFYTAALNPLGYEVIMEFGTMCGLGSGGKPDFWLVPDENPHGAMHLAFRALDRASVDEFHAAALAAGATDNGPPGLRLDYHPNYYGAFVIDLNGHNLEAVCHEPPYAAKAAPRRNVPPAKKGSSKAALVAPKKKKGKARLASPKKKAPAKAAKKGAKKKR